MWHTSEQTTKDKNTFNTILRIPPGDAVTNYVMMTIYIYIFQLWLKLSKTRLQNIILENDCIIYQHYKTIMPNL